MRVAVYTEPQLAVLVLDYAKPYETHQCLASIKQHLKVPHTVILCDNGSNEDYPLSFIRAGLADQLIVNRDSRGLGLGTRDLYALTFAHWTCYLQNDQVFARDLTEAEFSTMTSWIGGQDACCQTVASISLAGAPCGDGVYSERAHLLRTADYKRWEQDTPLSPRLGYHGAGPYHDGVWRERQLQDHYALNRLTHLAWPQPFVADNGVFAVRDMKEGGLWCHRTDTKQLWCIREPTMPGWAGPIGVAYPKLMEEERAQVLAHGWPDGQIPLLEQKDSFSCWDHTPLARMQDEYIADLRRRVAAREARV